jgi:hypothetical protein
VYCISNSASPQIIFTKITVIQAALNKTEEINFVILGLSMDTPKINVNILLSISYMYISLIPHCGLWLISTILGRPGQDPPFASSRSRPPESRERTLGEGLAGAFGQDFLWFRVGAGRCFSPFCKIFSSATTLTSKLIPLRLKPILAGPLVARGFLVNPA